MCLKSFLYICKPPLSMSANPSFCLLFMFSIIKLVLFWESLVGLFPLTSFCMDAFYNPGHFISTRIFFYSRLLIFVKNFGSSSLCTTNFRLCLVFLEGTYNWRIGEELMSGGQKWSRCTQVRQRKNREFQWLIWFLVTFYSGFKLS